MNDLTVQVNGKEYPILWNNKTTFEFARHRGKSTVTDAFKEFGFLSLYIGSDNADKVIEIEHLEVMIEMAYFAIKTGCKKAGVKLDLTLDDLYEEIDNMGLLSTVIICVYASLPVLRDDSKKKAAL